jgi:hypothetical protein
LIAELFSVALFDGLIMSVDLSDNVFIVSENVIWSVATMPMVGRVEAVNDALIQVLD